MVSLVTKIVQLFFFFSKRSEARWVVVKTYIPPTHQRLPRSLFSFGGVLRERVRVVGDTTKGKVTKTEGLFTLALSHHHDRKERG